MKKTFFILLLCSVFDGAKAQLTKDNWLVGGTGKLYAYNQDYTNPSYSVQYKYTDIGIYPSVGYFVMDKLAFGLRPSFSSLKGGKCGCNWRF